MGIRPVSHSSEKIKKYQNYYINIDSYAPVRLTVIKAKTRPGIEATLYLSTHKRNAHNHRHCGRSTCAGPCDVYLRYCDGMHQHEKTTTYL